jgi:hypothetical protein
MRKANNTQVVAINKLMLKTTEDYVNTFVNNDESDVTTLTMYAFDVAHNINALVAFNASKDAEALHESIMQQDTLVREYYIDTLRYIESNKLINSNMFCCV